MSTRSNLIVFVIVISGFSFSIPAAGSTCLYLTSGSSLERINLDGTGHVTLIGTGNYPWALDIDSLAEKIYWAAPHADKIQRSNFDGTGVEDLVVGHDAHRFRLDNVHGKMYWVETEVDRIMRSNLDGSGVEQIIDTFLPWEGSIGGKSVPLSIALDIGNEKIYWTDTAWGRQTICRANFDGSGIETIAGQLNIDENYMTPIALDTLAQKVYFGGGTKIYRMNFDGTGQEALGGPSHARGIALDLSNSQFYTADSHGRIERAALDGSNWQLITVVLRHIDFY